MRGGKRARARVEVAELPGSDERQGKIGLSLQTLDAEVAGSLGLAAGTRGAVVAEVAADRPAERAGLHPGDVVVQVDGVKVESADDAVRELKKTSPRPRLLRVVGPRGARLVSVRP